MKTSHRQRQDLDKAAESGDITENTDSYRFLCMFDLKINSLKYKELVTSLGALEGEKKGPPENEGKSGVIYKNKGLKRAASGKSGDINENKQVIRFPGKVDENKGS